MSIRTMAMALMLVAGLVGCSSAPRHEYGVTPAPAKPLPKDASPVATTAAAEAREIAASTIAATADQRAAVETIRTEAPEAPAEPLQVIDDRAVKIADNMGKLSGAVAPKIDFAAIAIQEMRSQYTGLKQQYEALIQEMKSQSADFNRRLDDDAKKHAEAIAKITEELQREKAAREAAEAREQSTIRKWMIGASVVGWALCAGLIAWAIFSAEPKLIAFGVAAGIFAGIMSGLTMWFVQISLACVIGLAALIVGVTIFAIVRSITNDRQKAEVIQIAEVTKAKLREADPDAAAEIYGDPSTPADKGKAALHLSPDTMKLVDRIRRSGRVWTQPLPRTRGSRAA